MTDTTSSPRSADDQRQALLARWRNALLPIPERSSGGSGEKLGSFGERTPGAPLSFSQERLWLLDQVLDRDSHYNTIPTAARLKGELDVDRLRRALGHVVRRHEVMRTRVEVVDGKPRQFVDDAVEINVQVVDLRAEADPVRVALERMRSERHQRFDLETGPLFATRVYRLADGDVMLLHLMHHVVSDGWSDDVLLRDLGQAYLIDAPLPELSMQYGEYASRQREDLDDEATSALLQFWSQELDGAPLVLDLPVDHPRPLQRRYLATTLPVHLSKDVSDRVRQLARETESTPYTVLLGAVGSWLSRYAGPDDVLIGSPVAGRSAATQLEQLIGCFVNTVVMRVETWGDPDSREVVARVRRRVLSAIDHQELPFDLLVNHLQPPRDPSRHPVFQVMFALQNSPTQAIALGGFRMTPVEIDNAVAKFDITVDLHEFEGEYVGRVQFDSDLFDPETCALLLDHLHMAVAEFVADPDRPLSLHGLTDRTDLERRVAAWNDTQVSRPARRLHDVVLQRAVERPDAIAVSAPTGQLSYRGLVASASALAAVLQDDSVCADTTVALLLERDLWAPVAIVGTLIAGAAYVPLDPGLPRERIAQMLADCGAPVVITQVSLRDRVAGLPVRVVLVDDPDLEVDPKHGVPSSGAGSPDGLAYVIYTSGSTGSPKGVMVSHAAAANMIESTQEHVGSRPDDVVLQYASTGFDVSVLEIFLALMTGSRLVLVDGDTALDPRALERLAKREQVTVMDVPPAMLERLDPPAFATLRIQFIGCEAFSATLVSQWQSGTHRLINGYGPTEATVMMTLQELDEHCEQTPPIGTPMPNHAAYLLDRRGAHVSPKVQGDLHIAGIGLARGYLGRPGLTAERFGPDPFGAPGSRMYRTGDLCVRRTDGSLVFVGRSDTQVKLRGLRIETGEIENQLAQHPAVSQAAVCLLDDEEGKRLVAYAATRGQPVPVREVLAWLRERLPMYMVPHRLVWLDALPLLASGKVNRQALVATTADAVVIQDATAVSTRQDSGKRTTNVRRSPQEHVQWAIREVLGVDAGPEDTFFDLGGNSLQLAELQDWLRQDDGIDISLRELYQGPTVAQLAAMVTREGVSPGTAAVPASPDSTLQLESSVSELTRRDVKSSLGHSAGFASGRHVPELVDLGRAQRAVWARMEHGIPVAVKPLGIRLPGPVDADALSGALRTIATRHSLLQHTIEATSEGPRLRRTLDPADAIALTIVAGVDPRPDADIVAAHSEVPLDAATGPLLAVAMHDRSDGDRLVCITAHPLIWDGRSRELFVRELSALMSGRGRFLPILPLQYVDVTTTDADAPLHALAAASGPVSSFDALRGVTAAVAEHEVQPSAATVKGLQLAQQQLGQRFPSILLGAFAIALSRAIPQLLPAPVIGIPLAGRHSPGSPVLLGRFVRTLPTQIPVQDADTVREVLSRAHDALLGLVDVGAGAVCAPDREEEWDDGPGPRITFDFVEPDSVVRSLQTDFGARLISTSRPQTDFELTASCVLTDEQLRIRLVWRADLFDELQVQSLTRMFLRVLDFLEDGLDRQVGDLSD